MKKKKKVGGRYLLKNEYYRRVENGSKIKRAWTTITTPKKKSRVEKKIRRAREHGHSEWSSRIGGAGEGRRTKEGDEL